MTHFSVRPLVAAMSLALTGVACAADGDASIWSFRGFGTISAVHSSEHEADFTGNIFQVDGAGRTRATSLSPDSKLGAQLTATFTPQLTGVVQVLSQYQYDKSYTPQIEWANLKYDFSPAFRARIGRIGLPAFLVSETRYVGFANTWARPPQEIYSIAPITSSDGVDATYLANFGNAVNTLQAFYGNSTPKLSTGEGRARPTWGLNNSLEMGSTTLRAGVVATNLTLDVAALQGLIGGLKAYGNAAAGVPLPAAQTAAAQAYAMNEKYSLENMRLKFYSLGVSHDTGDWLFMAEYSHNHGAGLIASSDSWYGTVARRIGNFTPYVTLADTKATLEAEPGISTAGLPGPLVGPAVGLTAGVNGVRRSFASSQSLVSVGMRWDAMKNVALKAQYDHLKMGEGSKGRLVNPSPAYQPGGSVDLVTLGVDFLF